MSSLDTKDLIEIIDFKNGKQAPKTRGGIPIYGGNGILGYCNKWNYEDTLVVGRVGAYCGSIHIANGKCWVSDNAIAGIPKIKRDIEYLYYLLGCLNLNKKQIGSSQPLLTQSILNSIKVKVHQNENSRTQIAKVLSDLDAKIELNNKINQELERVAKTLYDYWFVQFDFPCLPENYSPARFAKAGKFSGAVKPDNFDSVMTYKRVGGLPVPDGRKWFVYVIETVDGTLYKGITNDLYRRYYEHYTGQGAEWTKVHKPKRVIHYEVFETQQEAAKREKELKTGYGRTWLKREYEKFLKYGYIAKDGLPAHQTCLMTAGKMVYNEELKREIPEGWEVENLKNNSLAKLIKPKINNFEGKKTYLATADVQNQKINFQAEKITFKERPSRANMQPVENSIWFAKMKNSKKVLYFSNYSKKFLNDFILSTGFAGLKCEEKSLEYIWGFINNDRFEFIKDRLANGATQEAINNDTMVFINLIIPRDDILEKYHLKTKSIYQKIYNNQIENQQLTALRDWLLPMLMNGQVTVKEAEEKLSMAAEPQAEYKKG